jgi:hypothetical protein
MTREEAILAYRRDLLRNPRLLADLHEIRGKDLLCWCYPLSCHVEILIWVANGPLA